MSIKITFNNHNGNNKCIEFEDSITIHDLFQKYFYKCRLSETEKEIEYHDKDGSVKKMEIKPNYIFMYNGRILDRESLTTLKNFFKNKKSVNIKVIDQSSIIGGNNNMIEPKRKI